jgi:hypothetical protein
MYKFQIVLFPFHTPDRVWHPSRHCGPGLLASHAQ